MKKHNFLLVSLVGVLALSLCIQIIVFADYPEERLMCDVTGQSGTNQCIAGYDSCRRGCIDAICVEACRRARESCNNLVSIQWGNCVDSIHPDALKMVQCPNVQRDCERRAQAYFRYCLESHILHGESVCDGTVFPVCPGICY